MKIILFIIMLITPVYAQNAVEPFNSFISGLPSATTPLATGDSLYVLQGGSSKKVPPTAVGSVNSVFNVLTYGMACDGVTDDTAAWVTLLATVPNDAGAVIQFPVSCTMLVTGISLNGKSGIHIQGATATSGGANVAKPTIKYNGAAGGTMITCTPCANMYIEGIAFDLNNLADNGFKAVWASSPFVTQTVTFKRVSFYSNAASGGTGRTNAKLIDWCSTGATSNCELLVVEDSFFNGSGTSSASVCIFIGHANAVVNHVTGNILTNCGTGASVKGESRLSSNIGESNGVDVNCAANEPVEIAMFRSENSNQFFTGACPVYLHDNRIADVGVTCSVNFTGVSGTVLFMNNQFNPSDTLAPFCTPIAEFVISYANLYPNAAVSGGRVTAFASENVPNFISFIDQPGVRSEVANTLYGSNITPSNPVTVQGVVGVAQSFAGDEKNSGVLGQLKGSGGGAAVRGAGVGLGTAGVIPEAVMFEADFTNSAMIGNGTSAYGLRVDSPGGTVGNWTNIYGAYISPVATATITNAFGIYQAGANDGNVFAGPTTMASLSVTTGATCAAGTVSAATQVITNGITTHC